MTWPPEIYCATRTLGVYYTDNFIDPTIQPIWTTVNDGLPATAIYQFELDPFEPGIKQYAMLTVSHVLYRRDNRGSWVSILTPNDFVAMGLTGGLPYTFGVDTLIPGRLWVSYWRYGYTGNPDGGEFWMAYTSDWGLTWTLAAMITHSDFSSNSGGTQGGIISRGDKVWFSCWMDISPEYGDDYKPVVVYSNNKGATWGMSVLAFDGTTRLNPIIQNPLQTDRVYTSSCSSAPDVDHLLQVLTDGSQIELGEYLLTNTQSLWFDPNDEEHQRIIRYGEVEVTTDNWATYTTAGYVGSIARIVPSWVGCNGSQMILGETGNYLVGTLNDETDTYSVNIAGTKANTSPYTNSIPRTTVSGGITIGGLRVVGLILCPPPEIFVHDVEYV